MPAFVGGLASQPMDTRPQYDPTPAARYDLAASLAHELKGTGVASNVVSPGAVLVEATKELVTRISPARGWGDMWEEIRPNAVSALIPNDQERFGEPDEMAAAVAYLCGGYAQYVSGATIRAGGGLKVSRAAFCARRNGEPGPRAVRDTEPASKITEIHDHETLAA
ncbi:SDR family oxidoreductase [Streptomyces sp. NPDC088560]|uniref:SDR family oxidoreductase n=1 Tax=Streptomyces sp. NPDC088560 TaxID=3365868 RepID=UPI00380B91C2